MSKGITFREIDALDTIMLYKWRRSHRVSVMMSGDPPTDLATHCQWLDGCYRHQHYYHWVIEINGFPAGLINICDYDPVNRLTFWGYYIGDDKYLGYGALIPPYLYNFLFTEMAIDKIEAEVFERNAMVIGMHKYHGYQEVPFFDKDLNNGHLKYMFLDKDDWLAQKQYARFRAEFPMTRWLYAPAR